MALLVQESSLGGFTFSRSSYDRAATLNYTAVLVVESAIFAHINSHGSYSEPTSTLRHIVSRPRSEDPMSDGLRGL